MRIKSPHFEQVPVELAEKILELQKSAAKPDGNRKLVIRKSGRPANRRHTVPKKVEVLIQ